MGCKGEADEKVLLNFETMSSGNDAVTCSMPGVKTALFSRSALITQPPTDMDSPSRYFIVSYANYFFPAATWGCIESQSSAKAMAFSER